MGTRPLQYFVGIILNTNKIQEKICAEIQYKPVFNSYKIVGLIFSKFLMVFSIRTCLHKHMHTSFRQILLHTALKILAGRI